MKKTNVIMAALAIVLVLSAGLDRAWAYFTTYASAEGGYTLDLGSEETIQEWFQEGVKYVQITSDAESGPVYIRAKVFYPEAVEGKDYKVSISGNGWSGPNDGWYYYDAIVNGGEKTEILKVTIGRLLEPTQGPDGVLLPNIPEDGENFNVVVVYESTPVKYNADGTPYADWSETQDSGSTEAGGGNEEVPEG